MSAINKSAVAQYFGFDDKPVQIRDNCKTQFYTKKDGATLFKEGGFGSISEVCSKTDCRYVAKVIPLAIPSVKKSFMREAVIAPVMGEVGIGPKIHDVFTCLNAGFIIMDTWEGSLGKLLEKEKRLKQKDLEQIGVLIDKMHRLGVIHNDMHSGNILYRINEKTNEREFVITDFGLALRFNDANQVLPNSEIPNTVSPNIFFPAFDYHRISSAIESRSHDIFMSYYIDKGYLTLLEYVLVDKYWWRDNKYDGVTFLDFLQGQKIAKNMIRTLPRNPEEMFLPLSESKKSITHLKRKTTKKSKFTKSKFTTRKKSKTKTRKKSKSKTKPKTKSRSMSKSKSEK